MNITPLQDRVVVKRVKEEGTLESGLYIPESAQEKSQEGKVVSVGPGKVLDNGVTVQVGVNVDDRILFGKYAGTDIKIDGKEYLILRSDEIFARLS